MINPEVIAVAVRDPILPEVAKRFVDEARVENKLVLVAFVVVAFTPVEFCRVVEEVTRRLVVVALPPSRFLATKADGTEPMIFLGVISPSHVGVTLSVPPTSTPRYRV